MVSFCLGGYSSRQEIRRRSAGWKPGGWWTGGHEQRGQSRRFWAIVHISSSWWFGSIGIVIKILYLWIFMVYGEFYSFWFMVDINDWLVVTGTMEFWMTFHIYIGNNMNPTDELIFFQRGRYTTNQSLFSVHMYIIHFWCCNFWPIHSWFIGLKTIIWWGSVQSKMNTGKQVSFCGPHIGLI